MIHQSIIFYHANGKVKQGKLRSGGLQKQRKKECLMTAATAKSVESMILYELGVVLREPWSRFAGEMDFLADCIPLGIM